MTEPQAWPIDKIERGSQPDTYNVWLKGDYGFSTFDAEQLVAANVTPPPDPIDFATLPVGTVVEGVHDHRFVLGADGEWYAYRGGGRCRPTPPSEYGPYTVVHQPGQPSVRDAFHTLGLTDDDITRIARDGAYWEDARFLNDAAREAEQQP